MHTLGNKHRKLDTSCDTMCVDKLIWRFYVLKFVLGSGSLCISAKLIQIESSSEEDSNAFNPRLYSLLKGPHRMECYKALAPGTPTGSLHNLKCLKALLLFKFHIASLLISALGLPSVSGHIDMGTRLLWLEHNY